MITTVSTQLVAAKKGLKRIDWSIVGRLVVSLHDEGKMKRTSLAMKCNLAYDKCILYLDWMKLLGLIKDEADMDGFERISLEEKGHEIFLKQFTA
jgi:predicted transcriptional regulator